MATRPPKNEGWFAGAYRRFTSHHAKRNAKDNAQRARNRKYKKENQARIAASYKEKYTGPAEKARASAVVEQNIISTNWHEVEQERFNALSPQDQASELKLAAKNKKDEASRLATESTKEQKRYIDNVQSFLYAHIDKIRENFKRFDSETKDRKRIHRAKETVPDGSYINLVSNRGPVNATGALYSQFVHATPAQLAHLQPLLRFFMVGPDGAEDEIYFSDYTTAAYAKKIANLRSSGDINDVLSPRANAGSDAGIKSFTWNYQNKHEGDYIIEANLELYFGTLAELSNINYLQFLFPTGNAVELAHDLKKHSTNVSKGESRGRGSARSDRLTALGEKIESYQDILAQPGSDKDRIPKILNDKTIKAARKKEFRQLKVVVGWSVPKGNQAQLKKSFSDPISYETFKSGLEATNKAIFLNLADYNVEFQQEGPTTLSLKYLGSTDNYLATAASDIFGSNNFDDNSNDFVYKETAVSIDGFLTDGDKIIDVRRSEAKEISKLSEKGASIRSDIVNEPYLQSIIRRQGGVIRDSAGNPTLAVTLAGLRAAQELQSLQIQRAQLQQKDENSPELGLMRLRGTLLTLLYDRAITIRLRDVYSGFLDKLITTDYIQRARIETDGSPTGPPKLILDPIKITEKEKQDIVREKSLLRPSEQGPRLPPSENTIVYYMRLGDLLHRAMRTSDLREDISLILGNTKRMDFSHSVYDIPITIDVFGQFFFNRVVSRKLRAYPFRYFLNDILKVVSRTVNQNSKTFDRIAFDYTVVSGRADMVKDLPFSLDTADLQAIGRSQEHPLAASGQKFQHFYPIFETNTSHKGRTGDRVADEREGIYHYVIGSDKGLAKNFNFSRQDTQYFQEMLIESNNLDDKIQALFLPQNVSLTMFGNTLHKNGDLIYIDSRPSLGSFAGPVLGIGGYYRVIRSTHQISNRGYETSLECVFELRVSPDKSRRK